MVMLTSGSRCCLRIRQLCVGVGAWLAFGGRQPANHSAKSMSVRNEMYDAMESGFERTMDDGSQALNTASGRWKVRILYVVRVEE